MMISRDIIPAYPTLIGRFQIAAPTDANQEMSKLLRGLELSQPGQQYANAGGWHSGGNLLETSLPAIAALRGWIGDALKSMVAATAELPEVKGRGTSFRGSFRLTAWGNIIRRGNYHRHHNHPNSAWSGVYYVAAGSSDPGSNAGVLELFDPRTFTEIVDVPGSPYGQRVLIRPQEGLMVLFPGWLYHFVHPYQGEAERISIAFNAAWEPAA